MRIGPIYIYFYCDNSYENVNFFNKDISATYSLSYPELMQADKSFCQSKFNLLLHRWLLQLQNIEEGARSKWSCISSLKKAAVYMLEPT